MLLVEVVVGELEEEELEHISFKSIVIIKGCRYWKKDSQIFAPEAA